MKSILTFSDSISVLNKPYNNPASVSHGRASTRTYSALCHQAWRFGKRLPMCTHLECGFSNWNCICRRSWSRPSANTTRSPETGGDTGLSRLMDFPHFKLSGLFASTEVASSPQPLRLDARTVNTVRRLAILFHAAAYLWLTGDIMISPAIADAIRIMQADGSAEEHGLAVRGVLLSPLSVPLQPTGPSATERIHAAAKEALHAAERARRSTTGADVGQVLSTLSPRMLLSHFQQGHAKTTRAGGWTVLSLAGSPERIVWVGMLSRAVNSVRPAHAPTQL